MKERVTSIKNRISSETTSCSQEIGRMQWSATFSIDLPYVFQRAELAAESF